jgi:uncharacterized RDD family membrane protein YckC
MAQQPPQPPQPPTGGNPPPPDAYPPPSGYPPYQGYGQPGAYPPPSGYPPYQGYGQPGAYPPPGYAPAPYGVMPRYGGFWIRVVAYIIDVVVIAVGMAAAIIVAALLARAVPVVSLVLIVAAYAGAICYQPYMWWTRGATIGQKALGLRVVRAADGGPISGGTATIRLIGLLISAWVLYLGLIWVAFEPRKRGWHDMMADTVVIRVD